MTDQRPLVMKLSLDVLQHLGLNLYSNVPAVLSEIVANSWDADAERVCVNIDKEHERIVIKDDGIGMTRDDIIDRFLFVGYQRRNGQPGRTSKDRLPMGRKGIGKLSLFSIANTIVVETIKSNQRTALCMRLDDVRRAIKENNGEYRPKELATDSVDFDHGTRITLTALRKRQTIGTAQALRKRLARRFSIIGPKYDFEIAVNGTIISPKDRGYYDYLQYIWTYGDQSHELSLSKNLAKHEERKPEFPVSEGRHLTIDGWLGTVRESGQLRDEHGENLNRIAIFVRGKMAQEDLLGDLTERGLYANYLIGELRVDGLDTASGFEVDDDEDSATSSRQRIVEDDPRYVALKKFLCGELKLLQKQWSELRVDAGSRSAMEIPEVKNWIKSLSGDVSGKAKRWLGRLNKINVGEESERRQLIKHSVLAFEFYRWSQSLDRLDAVDDENLESVVRIFRELDSIEATLYGQIVQKRIAVIRALQEKVTRNSQERVIQDFIFNHLWLLDPHWERVDASEVMEKRVESLFRTVSGTLSREQRKARIDIGYRKTAGKHVIIELKRPDVSLSVYDLGKQIEKYRSGLLKILEKINRQNDPIEFICLLGKEPQEWNNPRGKETVEKVLAAQNARYVNYDDLLESAYKSYSDYLQRAKKLDHLGKVIEAIDNYAEK